MRGGGGGRGRAGARVRSETRSEPAGARGAMVITSGPRTRAAGGGSSTQATGGARANRPASEQEGATDVERGKEWREVPHLSHLNLGELLRCSCGGSIGA